MRQAGPWLLLLVLAAGAAGFFLWKKTRRHSVIIAVSASGCRGGAAIDEKVWKDGETLVNREHTVAGGDTGTGTWTSEEHRHPAGTQYSVLARGDCKSLACRVLIDGSESGAKETDSGQVSCSAMVGD
ncbi:MAG TPA: hypothetical protein VKZ63_10290 [Kofleriaceae bacterium]|nr:hypothetical protein [Kofleriaceae bacterium]